MNYQVKDIISCEKCGNSAEVVAAEGEKLKLKLLDQGAVPMLCSKCGKIYCAVCMTDSKLICPNCSGENVFKPLGDFGDIKLPTSDTDGFLSIYSACRSDDKLTEITGALDEDPALITQQTGNGEYLLHAAALGGAAANAALLLDRGAKIDAVTNRGYSALHYAADSGTDKVSKLLLNRGANVNLVGNEGESAIMSAVSNGYTSLTKTLLEHGANLEQRGQLTFGGGAAIEITPLLAAAYRGNVEIIGILAEAGARINYADPLAGATAVMLTISGGTNTEKVIRELHRHGANLNISNSDGNSALTLAKDSNKKNAERVLLELGAKESGDCFIAGAVYEDEGVIQIDQIRRWRDDYLANHSIGRIAIVCYQVIGPHLASLVHIGLIPRRPLRWLFDRFAVRVSASNKRQ